MSRRPGTAAIWLAACLMAGQSSQAFAQPRPNEDGQPGNEIGTGMSLPKSDAASNMDSATTHSDLAPRLPSPPAGDDIQTLLLAARAALAGRRTGEAQESLERAETRSLDRSVVTGTERMLAESPLVAATGQARAALAAGDVRAAIAIIDAALPQAAQADLPR